MNRCTTQSLRSKTRQRTTLLPPKWILSTVVDREWRSASQFPVWQSWRFHSISRSFHSEKPFCMFPCLWRVYLTALRYGLAPLPKVYSEDGTTFILSFSDIHGQWYVREHLKSFLMKFYSQYRDLIQQYDVPSPKCYVAFWGMILCSDSLHWSDITLTHDFVTKLDCITEFHFIIGFQRTIATGAASIANRGNLLLSHLGIACVLMLRQVSPELVIFPDF